MLGYIQPYARFYSVGFYFLIGVCKSGAYWGVFCQTLYNLMLVLIVLGCVLLGCVLPIIGFCKSRLCFLFSACRSGGCWGVLCWVVYYVMIGFVNLGCILMMVHVALQVVRVCFVGFCTTLC